MKYYIATATILLVSIIGYSQEYHPLLSNSGWCCETCYGTGCTYIEYPKTGPELLDTELYYRIGSFYIQEDTITRQVVYLRDGEKKTLYDFMLITNDTFQIELYDTIHASYIVDQIDTVNTLAGKRKRWNLLLKDTLTIGGDTLNRKLIWIEGIGSTYGPLYHKSVPMWASGTCLEGVYSKEQVQIYQGYCSYITGYWPDECKFISSIREDEPKDPTIIFFNNYGELVISSADLVNHVRVYDLKGTLLMNFQCGLGIASFAIPNHLPPGIYFCEFLTESRTQDITKVIKTKNSL